MLNLEYTIRKAKNPKSPVIFMLHGYGSNKDDLFSLKDGISDEITIISLQAPYGISDWGYAWYSIILSPDFQYDKEQFQSSLSEIYQFIKQACIQFDLDENRITLLGFSQGCILSLALALLYPNKIKKVVALSGFIQKDFLNLTEIKEKNFKDTHIYMSHGISDTIIPIAWADESAEMLKNLNINLLYEKFEQGHQVSLQNYQSLCRWILKNS